MDSDPPIVFDPSGEWLVGRAQVASLADGPIIDAFRNACLAAMTDRSPRFMALDLTGVTFIVSTALSSLLTVLKRQRESGGTLVLCGLDANIARMLHIARLDRVFEIFPTTQALLMSRPNGLPSPAQAPPGP